MFRSYLIIKKPMKSLSILMLLSLLFSCSCNSRVNLKQIVEDATNSTTVKLSVAFLKAVKEDGDYDKYVTELEHLNPDSLQIGLKNDIQKKAFWLNIYNAFIQIKLKEDSSLHESRNSLFSDDRFKIAGEDLSFDKIEHGILRKSAFKLGFGYISKPFVSDFIKQNEVNVIDYRIHFALNCGAKSCPSIAVYEAYRFNAKINEVAKSFLNKTSNYNNENEEVMVTKLFSWFRGDFGGKDGILEVLKYYEIIPESKQPDIEYQNYDWTLSLGNYYD